MSILTATGALRTMTRGTIVLAACAAAGAFAQPSIDVNGRADVNTVTRTKVIAISDLNLRDPSGQRRLDQRLRHTASYVCDDAGMLGTRPPKDYIRCYSDALTSARSLVAQRVASGDMRPIRVATR